MPRLNVNINDDTAAILSQFMDEHGKSATEAVRYAFAFLGYHETLRRQGKTIEIVDRQEETSSPPLRCLAEPRIGATLIENDEGHSWTRYEDGWWYCSCGGEDEPWSWEEMIDDIGDSTYKYEVVFDA